MTQKTLLHITVGTPDWEPTAEDLRNICEDFKGAVLAEGDSVVVTRTGVVAQVSSVQKLELEEGFDHPVDIRVISANIGVATLVNATTPSTNKD